MDSNLLSRIQKLEHIKYEHSVSDGELRQLEADLGFVLPEDYVEFIKAFGFLMIDGRTIRGACPIPSEDLEGFSPGLSSGIKEKKKVSKFAGATPDFVVVEADSGGGYTLLRRAADGSCPLECWQRDGNWYILQGWNSFTDYLEWVVSTAEYNEKNPYVDEG